MRRADYERYLKSYHWKCKRRAALFHHGKRCFKCGESGRILQVHHLHYRSLGNENVATDLVVLCKECHKALHRQKRAAETNISL